MWNTDSGEVAKSATKTIPCYSKDQITVEPEQVLVFLVLTNGLESHRGYLRPANQYVLSRWQQFFH